MSKHKLFGTASIFVILALITVFIGLKVKDHRHQAQQKALQLHVDAKFNKYVQEKLMGKVCHYAPQEYNDAVAAGAFQIVETIGGVDVVTGSGENK